MEAGNCKPHIASDEHVPGQIGTSQYSFLKSNGKASNLFDFFRFGSNRRKTKHFPSILLN